METGTYGNRNLRLDRNPFVYCIESISENSTTRFRIHYVVIQLSHSFYVCPLKICHYVVVVLNTL